MLLLPPNLMLSLDISSFVNLEDSYIPSSITGAAVGIISFIGYLPDIFVGPLFGFLLDLQDIKVSFKIFFVFLFLISTVGLITAIYLKKQKD